MSYEIDKKDWYQCKICNQKIQELAKTLGGNGTYYYQVFIKHLESHNLSLENYFIQHCGYIQPVCKCGQCNQLVSIKRKGNFKWKEFACGRYPGQQEWSKQAKITRVGINNPMYGKKPWNQGLNKDTCPTLKEMGLKQTGKIISDETRKKQSESAKKRLVHGHTGHYHSEETKEKFRQITLKRINNGEFAQTKTAPHLRMATILQEINLSYIEEKIQYHWTFDFYLPEYNIYIEVDGDYFHSNPKFYPDGPKTKTQRINWYRDIKKNNYCSDNDLILWRFWENDILNNPENIKDTIICRLKELLELKN